MNERTLTSNFLKVHESGLGICYSQPINNYYHGL